METSSIRECFDNDSSDYKRSRQDAEGPRVVQRSSNTSQDSIYRIVLSGIEDSCTEPGETKRNCCSLQARIESFEIDAVSSSLTGMRAELI